MRNFFIALDSIGITELSDDDCCMLLAWFHNKKGSTEEVIYNPKLNRDIFIAQKRLNLFCCAVPNEKLVARFNDFFHELKINKDYPDWFRKIEIKYGLEPSERTDR